MMKYNKMLFYKR